VAAPNIKSKQGEKDGRECSRYGDRRNAYSVLVGSSEGKNHLEVIGLDGMIILKWIFKKWNGEEWTGLIWVRIGTGGGLL
jgi:hypothetical protein